MMRLYSLPVAFIATLLFAQGCTPPEIWYADSDGDGYGNPNVSITGSEPHSGTWVQNNQDCNDSDYNVNPGATEITGDGIDNDCNPATPDGAPEPTTWYLDGDGDSYGDDANTQEAVDQPSGYVAIGGDCDDSMASVNPGATEVYNGIDDDCDSAIDEGFTPQNWYDDGDGDGYGDPDDFVYQPDAPAGHVANDQDCDDTDATTYPGAVELADGKDNDCDGAVDEGVTTWYQDADGDDYGNASVSTQASSQPSGYVANSTDCDDSNANVNPGETEVYGNGLDDNCDGQQDEGFSVYYRDADNDSYGNPDNSLAATSQPSGYVTDATDCDDSNANTYPGATELPDGQDNNCNGSIDEGLSLWYRDADGDSYGDPAVNQSAPTQPSGYVANAQDCDDSNASVNPAASEVYGNGIDDNCNGQQDEGFTIYYLDADGDSYGDPGSSQAATSQPSGYVTNSQDCDDSNASTYPGATELADGQDNDCDGSVDEGVQTWYRDADGDGYGTDTDTIQSVPPPAAGYISTSGDCNDADAAINPAATEVTDGIDNNCNGQVDEGGSTWYRDADGDSFGDAGSTTVSISQPSGYVSDSSDCDDTNAAVNPAASEVFNGQDDNCNGQIDEGISTNTYYPDADGDNYGDQSSSGTVYETGTQPSGWILDNTDCNDANNAINPGATEVTDGVDNNCNGQTDEGGTTWYRDADGDLYGDPGTTTVNIGQPSGYVADNNDCDDTDSSINPGATEVYDGVDNNCSGGIDEGFTQYFQDADGDLYGNAAVSQWATSAPGGYVADSADCDDTDAAINPGADEVTDGVDNDCDTFVDEGGTDWYRDSDGDTYGDISDTLNYIGQPSGYVADSTDCDDTDPAINPGATEIFNSVDDNCNGQIDEGISTSTYYPDADGDNYGDEASSGTEYQTDGQPSGWVLDNTDCNDGNSSINPGASEVANGVDDNCNGEVDEGLGADYTNADVMAAWDAFFTEVVCSRASCVNPAGTGDFSFSCDTGSVTWDITASAVTQTFNNCTHTIQAGTYGSPDTSSPLYGITITVNGQIVGVPDGTQGDIYPDGNLTITGDYEATIFDQRDVHQQIPTVHNYGDASDPDHSFYTDVTCSAPSCATNAVRFFADSIVTVPYAATSNNPGLEGPTYDSGTEL